MNDGKLMLLVERAVKLDRLIAEQEETLKGLKKQLTDLAGSDMYEKTETEGGGWSVIFEGDGGCVARVTQPADKLKSLIDGETPAGAKVLALAGKFKDQLFRPRIKYIPTDDIRERITACFEKADARKILAAVVSKSAPTVSFETKES